VRRKQARQTRTEPQIDRAQARRELEVARKRELILESAARAFARRGYRATTMQDIAREAGYTPPSLYVYFASKEQIFLDLAGLLSREFMALFDERVPSELSFRERLERLLRGLFETADRHRDAVSIFVVERLSGETSIGQGMVPTTPDRPGNFSSLQLFTTWLRKNAKRGELGDNRPEDLGVALAGLVHAFCLQWLANGCDTPIAEQTSRVASLFLYGVTGASVRSRKVSRSRER
jgi:AcrR family transcriptional regulator